MNKSRILFWGALVFALVLILLSVRPSDASESHEIVSEGYQGSERFKLVETPLRASEGITVQKGWIEDKRVNLRTQSNGDSIVTRGWVGDRYIRYKMHIENDLTPKKEIDNDNK